MFEIAKSLKQLTKPIVTGKIRIAGAAAGTAVGTGVAGAIGSAVPTTTVVGTHVALGTPAVFAAFAAVPITATTAPVWLSVVTAGLVTAGGVAGLAVASRGAKKVCEWLDKL